MSRHERVQLHFFDLASQYYVCGRFALIGHLIPVAGHLLHHAVEMYLKGALATSLSLTELRKLSHRLTNIWQRFTAELGVAPGSELTNVVTQLDNFERIRYPDSGISDGAAMRFSLFKSHSTTLVEHTPVPTPEYELVLDEVDALVKLIFETAKVNPNFFFGRLNEHPRRFLYMHNNQFTEPTVA